MAYEFNGTNQRLNTTSSPVTGEPFTVACWFYADNNTANQRLVDLRESTGANSHYSVGLGGNVAGDPLRLNKFGSSLDILVTTTGYSLSTWHHACAVFSSATSRTVYLDAGGSATTTASVGGVTPTRIDIGAFTDSGNNLLQFFDGRMAEVGIWSVALTQPEIASLAKGITCDKVRPQSLVFYAPLVRDLIDVRQARTITNNNTATVANHPRVYA